MLLNWIAALSDVVFAKEKTSVHSKDNEYDEKGIVGNV
jgi:hypothetical protein